MDVRETILKRIETICGTVGASVKRMAVDAHWSQRPGIILNDGDESIAVNKGGLAPLIVTLRPQIILLVEGSNPGTAINRLRAALIKALLTDSTLAETLGTNGAIKYIGCETGINRAQAMEGDMALNFECNYVLNPTEL